MEKEQLRRVRISQSLIGNTRRLGTKVSNETKRKQSNSLKGKSSWNKGGSLSESTKQKMSLSRRGIPHPWMRRAPSKITKIKISDSMKKVWETPEIRKNIIG